MVEKKSRQGMADVAFELAMRVHHTHQRDTAFLRTGTHLLDTNQVGMAVHVFDGPITSTHTLSVSEKTGGEIDRFTVEPDGRIHWSLADASGIPVTQADVFDMIHRFQSSQGELPQDETNPPVTLFEFSPPTDETVARFKQVVSDLAQEKQHRRSIFPKHDALWSVCSTQSMKGWSVDDVTITKRTVKRSFFRKSHLLKQKTWIIHNDPAKQEYYHTQVVNTAALGAETNQRVIKRTEAKAYTELLVLNRLRKKGKTKARRGDMRVGMYYLNQLAA